MEVSKYYRGIYTFTKNGKKIPMPKFAVNIFAKEYMRKRNAACDCLNPFYESWNSEYTGTEPDDDIYSEKSREYNEYIRAKQEPILELINRVYDSKLVKLHSDEICDLVGVLPGGIIMTLHLVPIR